MMRNDEVGCSGGRCRLYVAAHHRRSDYTRAMDDVHRPSAHPHSGAEPGEMRPVPPAHVVTHARRAEAAAPATARVAHTVARPT